MLNDLIQLLYYSLLLFIKMLLDANLILDVLVEQLFLLMLPTITEMLHQLH
jgi:hypothetical protein